MALYEQDAKILNKISKKAKSKGWELIKVRALPHPDDSYMKFTLVRIGKKYATHLYNVNDNAFHEGHYDFTNKEVAMEELLSRK
jgi:hypothetical protein